MTAFLSRKQIKLIALRHPDPNERANATLHLWEDRVKRWTFFASIATVVSLPIALVALVVSLVALIST